MPTSQQDIRGWLKDAKANLCTHLIVVCDDFSHDDYPVQVRRNENVREIYKKYDGLNMQRVMEVYSLSLDIEQQLNERRAFNF